MNNIPTLRWLVWLLAIPVFLFSSNTANAQACTISFTPPQPVNVTLVLSNSGTATLDAGTVPFIGTTGGCGLVFSATNTFATSASSVLFNCNDATIGTPLTYYVRAEDGTPANNSPVVTLRIFIEDNTNPVLTCPPSIIVPNDLFNCTYEYALSQDQPVLTDNCLAGTSLDWTATAPNGDVYSGSNAFFSFLEMGTTTVAFTAADASGNTASCSFTVEVFDADPPLINCPPSDVFATDNGACSANLSFDVMADDNCGTTQLAYTYQAEDAMSNVLYSGVGTNITEDFPVQGPITISFMASDMSGNTADCSFTIEVEDQELPVITCPANTTVYLNTSCAYLPSGTAFNATATDNCTGSGALLFYNSYNGGSSLNGAAGLTGTGTRTITWTVEDDATNSSTCSFTITFLDTIPPVVGTFGATPITVNVTPGDCSSTVTFQRPSLEAQGGPSLADNCTADPAVTLTEGVPTVNGVPTPALLNTVPAFNPNQPQVTNNATVQFPTGTTVIPYIWTDASGNQTIRRITVIVNENIPPVARCQPGVVTVPLNGSGVATLTPAMVNNGSTDNCGNIALSVTSTQGVTSGVNTQFDCADLGNRTYTLTVRDFATHAQSSTCTGTVRVVDNLAPIANCPTTVTAPAGAGCQTTASTITGLAMTMIPADQPLTGPAQYKDNCAVTSITYSILAPGNPTPVTGTYPIPGTYIFGKGTSTVTYSFMDADGNSTACSFVVQITDATAPMWSGGQAPNSTITFNANTGGCLRQVTWTPMTFADNCPGTVNVTSNRAPGEFFTFGTTPVIYTATDAAGNINQDTFFVQIIDNQAPVARCKPAFSLYIPASGASVNLVADSLNNGSTDNCFFTLAAAPSTFGCANIGAQTVTLTVTDGNGNARTCTSTVTVRDTVRPAAICIATPITLALDANGEARMDATAVNNNSTDNCTAAANLALEVSKNGTTYNAFALFNCSERGNSTVTLRVTDAQGNSSTCTKTISVTDNILPTATAPANVTISCVQLPFPRATITPTDNCGTPTVTDLPDVTNSVVCANTYNIVRSWRVTDAAGNSSVVSQTISVQDNVNPTFVVKDTVRLTLDDAFDCIGTANYVLTADSLKDNCSSFANITILMTVDYPLNTLGFGDITTPVLFDAGFLEVLPMGTTTVVFRATDQCGRSATKTVRLIVRDNKAPEFTGTFSALCGQNIVKVNTPGACSNTHQWQRPTNTVLGDESIFDCRLVRVEEIISDPTVSPSAFNFFSPSVISLFPTAQFPVGITTVSYIATDAAGNKAECSFTVEVRDNQAPTLTCPPQQTLPTTCVDARIPNYANLVAISDNCQGSVVLTQEVAAGTRLDSLFKAPANPPAAGKSFTIKMTGKDKYNTSTCSFSVVLADGNAPIPTIPQLPALVDSCGGFIINAPTAQDPCNPNATIIYATPSTPVGMFLPGTPPRYNLTPGNYVITWVYNDGNGNISTQPQNITVLNDVFPPIARCKRPFTANLSAMGTLTLAPAQLDSNSIDRNACGRITLALNKTAYTCADLGIKDVILTVRDTNNNIATCTTKVTIKDVSAPAFSASPRDTTVNACAAIPAPVTLTALDACSGTTTVTRADTSSQTTTGTGKYNYTITRTWRTQDAVGNRASYRQTITVKDTTDPAFLNTLATRYVFMTPGNAIDCKAPVNFNIGKFITDCATGTDLRVSSSPAGFSLSDTTETLDFGVHTYIFTAKDTSGNISTRRVELEVKDGSIPTAACINGISVSLQNSGTVAISTLQVDANSFDNCTSRDSLVLRIQRLQANGTGIGVPAVSISFTCPDADAITRHKVKLFVKDKAGNEATCETYVVVQDNVGPNFTFCPPSKIIDCTASIDPTQNNNGIATAVDNCPSSVIVTYADVTTAGTGSTCLDIARTWTAKDLAGNISTCLQRFSVRDTLAPTLSLQPANVTVDCNSPLLNVPTVTAADNCTSAADIVMTFNEIRVDTALGTCGKYSYTLVRTWTAKDKCNNIKSHTQRIKVQDLTAPSFLGMPDTIRFRSANFAAVNTCTVPVNINLGQYLTDCTPDNLLRITQTAGPTAKDSLIFVGTFPVGSRKVFFTARDQCGNIGRDSILLQTIDNSTPTVVCNDNVIVALGSNSTGTLAVSNIELSSTDNCGIATRVLSKTSFTCADIGVQTVSLRVTDVNGNTNTCTANVTVTLGNNPGLVVNAVGVAETLFGLGNGSATVTASNGSGNYRYTWSTGATTTSLSNLAPGNYIVTVRDNGTSCIGIDTAIVAAGPQIELLGAKVAGAQKQIVNVPVKVRRFNRVYGFKFIAEVADTTIGKIIGVTGINPALNPGLLPPVISNFKANILFATGDSIALPDSTTLFNLRIELGTKAPTVSSNVLFSQLEFIQGLGSGPEMVPVVNTSGMVTIDKLANSLNVGGDIVTWRAPARPVPGVTVSLTGSKTATQTTAVPGTYLFSAAANDTTIVSCSKATPGNAQVTAADLLLIQNYIFGAPLTSPYQWVAADVDGNGMITLLDYVRISAVVLGTAQNIQGSPDWKFIPKSYVFPSPNPLSAPIPTSIRRNSINTAFLDDDFIAVRMGDVNGNIVPSLTNDDAGDRSNETFRFRLNDRRIEKGSIVEVPFRASDFTNRQAYQMTVNFDTDALALEDIQAGALKGISDDNFGTAHLANGHLTTVWVSNQPVTLRNDEVLFTLKFRALRHADNLESLLRPGSEITQAESYDAEGRTMPIEFEFVKGTNATGVSAGFALYQNRPNPFREATAISFLLPESASATIRIFNGNGQLVRSIAGDYEKGMNSVEFRSSDLGSAGVYYYELETPGFIERKKMVILE
jgi:hypothetical protein